jgi:hypothetical protein
MYDHIVSASPALPAGVVGPAALLADTTPEALQQLPALAALAAWQQRQQPGAGVAVGRAGAPSAELGALLEALHEEMRGACDTMGIGLGLPRNDTVAEVRRRQGFVICMAVSVCHGCISRLMHGLRLLKWRPCQCGS